MPLTPGRLSSVLAALVMALVSVALGGTAQAAPLPTQDLAVTITNVAHTNYLIPDDGVGNNGTYLQVYYRADHPFPRTFTFERVATVDGQDLFQWAITSTGNCAEARGGAGTSVYLTSSCNDHESAQWWLLEPNADRSAYALVPYTHEDLAVTGTFGDDNWAPLRELAAGRPTMSQLWYLAVP